MICYGDLDDYDRVKTVFISNDFDIDDDCSNHFVGMRSLERFEVCDKRSRFYTEDGVLFTNLRNEDRLREKEMFFDFPKEISGRVLVAFPTNYPRITGTGTLIQFEGTGHVTFSRFGYYNYGS